MGSESPKPVGSQLSVFLHTYWPVLLTFLQGLFNKLIPVPAPVTAIVGSQLSTLLGWIQTILAGLLASPEWTKERLTLELEAVDWVVSEIPVLQLPPLIAGILTTGLANIRKTIADQLAALT
jgi:hypothetical protein